MTTERLYIKCDTINGHIPLVGEGEEPQEGFLRIAPIEPGLRHDAFRQFSTVGLTIMRSVLIVPDNPENRPFRYPRREPPFYHQQVIEYVGMLYDQPVTGTHLVSGMPGHLELETNTEQLPEIPAFEKLRQP